MNTATITVWTVHPWPEGCAGILLPAVNLTLAQLMMMATATCLSGRLPVLPSPGTLQPLALLLSPCPQLHAHGSEAASFSVLAPTGGP